MKNIEIVCHLTEFDGYSELTSDDKKLIDSAKSAMSDAYAPYSRFNVGAVVLLDNGVYVKGNNQENASYPVGMCAERVAIFAASANYPGIKMNAIAISAKSDHFLIDKPVTPCGACRQAIAEYEHKFGKEIKMIMSGETGKILVTKSINNLLPYQFNSDDLNIK